MCWRKRLRPKKKSNNKLFWLLNPFGILDTSWQFWTHYIDLDPLGQFGQFGYFWTLYNILDIFWTLLDFQKHPKMAKVSKSVQICVMCPKLSRGVQNIKKGPKSKNLIAFFFWGGGHPLYRLWLSLSTWSLASFCLPHSLHYKLRDVW